MCFIGIRICIFPSVLPPSGDSAFFRFPRMHQICFNSYCMCLLVYKASIIKPHETLAGFSVFTSLSLSLQRSGKDLNPFVGATKEALVTTVGGEDKWKAWNRAKLSFCSPFSKQLAHVELLDRGNIINVDLKLFKVNPHNPPGQTHLTACVGGHVLVFIPAPRRRINTNWTEGRLSRELLKQPVTVEEC